MICFTVHSSVLLLPTGALSQCIGVTCIYYYLSTNDVVVVVAPCRMREVMGALSPAELGTGEILMDNLSPRNKPWRDTDHPSIPSSLLPLPISYSLTDTEQ
ncbi:unnamed protein product [Onchocerca flexuosa]|uniref:Secreted protein n=1 Tax=Onchocerca flexuosa TaxID=387005 RepID=A0A183HZK1_9BILA|nr:unnamed protein product [Onchocerca flexuosa]